MKKATATATPQPVASELVRVSELRGALGLSDEACDSLLSAHGATVTHDWNGRPVISSDDATEIMASRRAAQEQHARDVAEYEDYRASWDRARGRARDVAYAEAHERRRAAEEKDLHAHPGFAGPVWGGVQTSRGLSARWPGSPTCRSHAVDAAAAAVEAFEARNPKPLSFAEWGRRGRPETAVKEK